MTKVSMKSKWAAQIIGHQIDLDNLMYKLNNSVVSEEDHFISIIGKSYCLRRKKWDEITEKDRLTSVIERDLAVIRSCLDSLDGCALMNIGTIFELNDDGSIQNRSRDVKLNAVIIPREEDRASPQMMRSLIRLTEKNEAFKVAVSDLQAFASWHSVYNSVEACLAIWNGLNKYKNENPANGALIDRVKQTANWYRHASITFPFPKNPVSLDDSNRITKEFIKETATYLNPSLSNESLDVKDIIVTPNPYPGESVVIPLQGYNGGRGYEVGVVGQPVNWVLCELPED